MTLPFFSVICLVVVVVFDDDNNNKSAGRKAHKIYDKSI